MIAIILAAMLRDIQTLLLSRLLETLKREDERFHRLLHTLFYLCELADFEIEGRIVLIDKKTGRIWR